MVADVANQPGALPLLQYALTELFERRDGDSLELEAYAALGGAAGALSARAERLFEASGADGRRAIRQVLLRLVTLGEGREDTRRRVVRSDLDALDIEPALVDRVLDAFGRHRLLTFDREPSTREPTVEIAHEALLGSWQRLRGWIDGAREDLRLERQVAQSATEWRAAGRDPSFLLRGARLDQAGAWVERTDLAVGSLEREFLKASTEHRAAEHAAEAERERHEASVERRSRSRLRALVAVLTAAALVASVLTVIADRPVEPREADGSDRHAPESSPRQRSRASTWTRNGASRWPSRRSMRPATTASRSGRRRRRSIARSRRTACSSRSMTRRPANVAWSPDGRLFATGGTAGGSGTNDAVLWDARSGEASSRSPGTRRTSTASASASTEPGVSPPRTTTARTFGTRRPGSVAHCRDREGHRRRRVVQPRWSPARRPGAGPDGTVVDASTGAPFKTIRDPIRPLLQSDLQPGRRADRGLRMPLRADAEGGRGVGRGLRRAARRDTGR